MSRLEKLARSNGYIRESVIERFFVATCEALGYVALKFTSKTMNGLPDRLVLKDSFGEAVAQYMIWNDVPRSEAEMHVRGILGMCIEFVELKAPGKKPELHQLRRMTWLRKLGFTVVVIDSKELVQDWANHQ